MLPLQYINGCVVTFIKESSRDQSRDHIFQTELS